MIGSSTLRKTTQPQQIQYKEREIQVPSAKNTPSGKRGKSVRTKTRTSSTRAGPVG